MIKQDTLTPATIKKINNFWKWFQENEQSILNAILLGINTEEIKTNFDKKYSAISTRISIIICGPVNEKGKYKIIFTAYGYRKLFGKVLGLENQAPELQHFIPQAFIKPIQNMNEFKVGNDLPRNFGNHEFKVSELQMELLEYNSDRKIVKIKVYLPYYNQAENNDQLASIIDLIVMNIIGEIAFRKHIRYIQLDQIPTRTHGLLSLIELPEFIDSLIKINARGKTRQI